MRPLHDTLLGFIECPLLLLRLLLCAFTISTDLTTANACCCCRWGFWKRAASGKQLLADGHIPSSPASQHTLVIQDPVKPAEGSSSTTRQFSGMLSSVFASPTAQQQHLAVSRLHSELSRKPGSGSVAAQRRSTDAAGAAGSTSNMAPGAAAGRTAAAAAAAAGAAAATTTGLPSSDPLLQPGVLEAVNLKVDGKAVSNDVPLLFACLHDIFLAVLAALLYLRLAPMGWFIAMHEYHTHTAAVSHCWASSVERHLGGGTDEVNGMLPACHRWTHRPCGRLSGRGCVLA